MPWLASGCLILCLMQAVAWSPHASVIAAGAKEGTNVSAPASLPTPPSSVSPWGLCDARPRGTRFVLGASRSSCGGGAENSGRARRTRDAGTSRRQDAAVLRFSWPPGHVYAVLLIDIGAIFPIIVSDIDLLAPARSPGVPGARIRS